MLVSQQTTSPVSGVCIARPALTAKNASGDVLACFVAIKYAGVGDILVTGFLTIRAVPALRIDYVGY